VLKLKNTHPLQPPPASGLAWFRFRAVLSMNDYTTAKKYEIIFTQPWPFTEFIDSEIGGCLYSATGRSRNLSPHGLLVPVLGS
jgi:hypothetical protein